MLDKDRQGTKKLPIKLSNIVFAFGLYSNNTSIPHCVIYIYIYIISRFSENIDIFILSKPLFIISKEFFITRWEYGGILIIYFLRIPWTMGKVLGRIVIFKYHRHTQKTCLLHDLVCEFYASFYSNWKLLKDSPKIHIRLECSKLQYL